MNEQQIVEAFQNYLKGKGLTENSLSLHIFPELFIRYYQEVEFDEVDKRSDEDILLFQYGSYDWGDGNFFEVDFTRQFYEAFPESDSHQIYQQRTTFYFDSAGFEEIASFNIWSSECLDLKEFAKAVTRSPGYMAALKEYFLKRELITELI